MKRITVSMPDELSRLLEREAERRSTSVSQIVRVSLTQMLGGEEERTIPWAGLVCEPEMTYGSEIDEALEKDWADDIARDSR